MLAYFKQYVAITIALLLAKLLYDLSDSILNNF